MPKSSIRHRATRLLAALAAMLALASCGGGSGQVEPFEPTRIIAFGDESSLLLADGRKYSVNAFADGSTTTLDCSKNRIWVQWVADAFELKFPQCPGSQTAPTGVMQAAAGAKAADIKAQVDAVAASFGDKDIATIMVGANDVLELYGQYPLVSEADLLDEARRRGRVWGQQINRIAEAGPAVLVSTVIDLGLTPFALAEKAANADTDRAQLLTRLTNAYNGAMRLEIINDGRLIGLVFGDLETQLMKRYPGAIGLANVVKPVCLASAPLPGCTTATLVSDSGASSTTWVWADELHFSAGGQNRLGEVAAQRAKNNPF